MPVKCLITDSRVPIKIWTNQIEAEAVEQLRKVAEMPFIYKHVAVMPDVHAGKGSTVGTVIATTDCIIPAAVGADLGCGMMAVKTPFTFEQVRDKVAQIRHSIERSVPVGKNWNKTIDPFLENVDNDIIAYLRYNFQTHVSEKIYSDLYKGDIYLQLGSLGGGNHFIEMCLDQDQNVWLMLHSGSRNIGKKIGEYFTRIAKEECERYHINLLDPDLAYLPVESQNGKYFIHLASWAQEFAFFNRKEIMRRALKDLSYAVTGNPEIERLFEVNCHHNYISMENHYRRNIYVTRKGAIRARVGDFGIIPGSMGSKSFIVEGLGNEESFTSASHGAGRVMSRTEAKKRFTIEDLKEQTEGVDCRKDEDVIDEIPSAYKNIDHVMENQNDLVKVLYELKQIMCIKG